MFPVNTIIAWTIDNYHEQGNIIITILLLPLWHISNRFPSPRWENCWWWWFPHLGGKFPWRNRSARGQKCSCPSSASRRRSSIPKAFSLFFLGQNDLYTRRWAPEVGRGGHNPPGRAWGAWRAQVGCAHLVAFLWCLLAPVFLKYSIKILREF